MAARVPEGCPLLLDACCIINFFATGRIQEILQCLPYDCATSRMIVDNEIIAVARSTTPMMREVIPRSRWESLASVKILDLSGDEEFAEFVRFAAQLDDGEASVCALAVARGGAVATDDRKAIRLLSRLHPQIPVVQTSELLYEWTQLAGIPDDEIAPILRAVQQGARFSPRRDAPRFDWWERLVTHAPRG
jgi:predicted nucleic acid-binding protein